MADRQKNGECEAPTAKTIWSDADRRRQFLISDVADLPPGDFLLRTATRRQQWVDPSALAAFEVSAEEALAWAKAELGEVTRRLKRGLKGALFGAEDKDQGETEELKGVTI